MTIVFKDKTQIVLDVLARLKPLLPANADLTSGTPLRNIIEALMEETDIQYWQLQQVYNSGFGDYTSGADLDKLVALLGVTRKLAEKAIGSVVFFRATNAPADYFIPLGTLIQTIPGVSSAVQFETTNAVTLLAGTTSITANIRAVVAGTAGNMPVTTIKTINNPPIGIESVRNDSPTSGGTAIEADVDLLFRTKHILDSKGLGTLDALTFNIKNVSGVKQVAIQDMVRGIGTVDILVLTDVIPMIQAKKDEINKVIVATKGAGIDYILTEPIVDSIPVTVVLTMISPYLASSVITVVTAAINNYINNLNIGDSLILNQLRKAILNSNVNILDINISTPAANIVVSSTHIAKAGTITIS